MEVRNRCCLFVLHRRQSCQCPYCLALGSSGYAPYASLHPTESCHLTASCVYASVSLLLRAGPGHTGGLGALERIGSVQHHCRERYGGWLAGATAWASQCPGTHPRSRVRYDVSPRHPGVLCRAWAGALGAAGRHCLGFWAVYTRFLGAYCRASAAPTVGQPFRAFERHAELCRGRNCNHQRGRRNATGADRPGVGRLSGAGVPGARLRGRTALAALSRTVPPAPPAAARPPAENTGQSRCSGA